MPEQEGLISGRNPELSMARTCPQSLACMVSIMNGLSVIPSFHQAGCCRMLFQVHDVDVTRDFSILVDDFVTERRPRRIANVGVEFGVMSQQSLRFI